MVKSMNTSFDRMHERNTERTDIVAAIESIVRQISWQGQKMALQTLSRPEISLTMPQMITLFAIHNAGSCRMSELAEVTQQSAGTLTGIVDRLIEDGLVTRVRDAEDRRVVQVTLTPLGHERLARVEVARQADMAQMVQHFSNEQLVHLEHLMRMLLNGIYHKPHMERASLDHANAVNGHNAHVNHNGHVNHTAHQTNPANHNGTGHANHANHNGANHNGHSSTGNQHVQPPFVSSSSSSSHTSS